ncbi:hypothetical protein ACLBP3_29960, partial [Klebsiella pneumoniae]|uniref:hypothetical protein n=1 Tax=Klebsiella pneumoniae TaxID=573 RepID=UPI00396C2526
PRGRGRLLSNKKRSSIDFDDKTSFIESHKTKQRVTPGDIVAYNLDALDVVKLVHKIDDTVPVELIHGGLG